MLNNDIKKGLPGGSPFLSGVHRTPLQALFNLVGRSRDGKPVPYDENTALCDTVQIIL